MFYIIDYDTRTVECKLEEKEPLLKYIEENGLEMAVALISSKEELCLQLSIREARELHQSLTDKEIPDILSEEEIMRRTWDALETLQGTFPNYTPKLAGQLLKAAARRNADTPEPGTRQRKARKSSQQGKTTKPAATRQRKTRIDGEQVLILGEPPKKGTALDAVYTIVKEKGPTKFDEIVEDYIFEIDCTEKLARRYVNKCIRLGHLEKDYEI